MVREKVCAHSHFLTLARSIRINFIADGVVGANKAYNEHNNTQCVLVSFVQRERKELVDRFEQVFCGTIF